MLYRTGPSFGKQLERCLGGIGLFCYRRPLPVLLLAIVISAFSIWSARVLKVDPDLSRLLPDSYPSVQNLERLRRHFGGVGYVAVVAKSKRLDVLRRFADTLAERLDALPEIALVDHRRSDGFFTDRALYYTELDDLKRVRDRFKARYMWEVSRRNPFFVDLDDKPEPPVLEFEDIAQKYRGNRHINPFSEIDEETHYLDTQSGSVVILARPSNLASDLLFSQRVVDDVKQVVDETINSFHDSKISVAFTGRYIKKLDQQHLIESNLERTALLSLLLMLSYVLLHFRSFAAVLLLLVPLGIGLIWSYGLIALTLNPLNILTAFAAIILLGIGIDSGIHLLQRYKSERQFGACPDRAVYRCFSETGRAAFVAASTTIAAFIAISTSEFRGFREFGGLAAVGTAMVMLSYATVLPAFLGLSNLFQQAYPVLKHKTLVNKHITGYRERLSRIRRQAPAIFWLSMLGALVIFACARRVEFEYDFARLDACDLESYRLDSEVNRILGRSQTPLVVQVEGIDQARQVVRSIHRRKDDLGGQSGIDFVLSTADLVPENQREKTKIIGEIKYYLSRADKTALNDETADQFKRFERLTRAGPVSRDELPESVRRQIAGSVSSIGNEFVLVFPSISLSDGRRIRKLAKELSDIPLSEDATVSAAGEAMVLADVLDEVFVTSPRVLGATVVIVCVVLWLLLGRITQAVSCLLPAVLTLGCTTGILALSEIRFNYLNIVIIPVLLGMGVDGGAHLVTRYAAGENLERVLTQTGRAILGACLTTGIGFGALLAANHPGLRSFAMVAIIGMGVNAIVSLVIMPAGMALTTYVRRKIQSRENSATATLISTVGGAGYAPFAPGSLGALLALPVRWAFSDSVILLRVAVCLLVIAVGTLMVQRYLKYENQQHDPPEVVIDEFAGCLIALFFVPWHPLWISITYLLFRVLDIWKPSFIGYIDRNVRSGIGVMGDDVAAGLLAGVVLACIYVVKDILI